MWNVDEKGLKLGTANRAKVVARAARELITAIECCGARHKMLAPMVVFKPEVLPTFVAGIRRLLPTMHPASHLLSNIKSAWRATDTGIVPYNPDAVLTQLPGCKAPRAFKLLNTPVNR